MTRLSWTALCQMAGRVWASNVLARDSPTFRKFKHVIICSVMDIGLSILHAVVHRQMTPSEIAMQKHSRYK
jgi:hypothetical protein